MKNPFPVNWFKLIGLAIISAGFCLTSCRSSRLSTYKEAYRPQVHFSPRKGWMNDPNGMVYSKGLCHLFFQYYPDSTVWGPMHWGHATSADLIHWSEQPVALYPDSIAYIFSGSVVADSNNTSGSKKGTCLYRCVK